MAWGSRLRGRWTVSPRNALRLAAVSLAGLLFIVPSGALVRLTDSGLGCPDWPGCHGEVVPPMSGHAWIEYSNRVASAVVVLLTVLAWIAVRFVPDAPKGLRRWSAVPAVAGIAQGPLGGLTVLFDLHPLLVASHFLLSMLALGGGTVFVLQARDHANGQTRGTDVGRGRLAALTLAGLGGVIVTGVLVTAAGPHSGDPAVIRRLGNLADAAAVHVRFVIGFVILAAALGAWLVRRRPADPLTLRLAVAFIPLLALQIGLGEYQYRHHLPWRVILAHVTVAGLLWSVGVAVAWLSARPLRAPAAADVYAGRTGGVLVGRSEPTVSRQTSNT
jgi:cytochrome c oxidase assembly protein subunit 15